MTTLTIPVLGPLAIRSFEGGGQMHREVAGARALALAGHRNWSSFSACVTVITRVESRELGH
ncbi:hypothetical protein JOF56_000307 [Kibdelosporangium banguiense]|uniref:Uncharacterized protein n=1 Tax=Kibdelosporangium banguiense TaxID=1365924 RepID=A0ABS4T637_9PSEU|nr:hypothetical protein [Kibdelosporangium banguiense]MBP2319922.1 hypothetical protein [Kibdelosporangium banguiense]